MKSALLREFVRSAILEVDVMPGGQDAHAQAALKLSGANAPKSPSDASDDDKKRGTAGKSYQKKEDTRKKVQDLIVKKIKMGTISHDSDLARYLADERELRKDGEFADDEDVKLAVTALRGVPVSIWKQLHV